MLANSVAGIMLAITQPLRIGDWVTFEDNYGIVEDVRLTFTVLRTASDQRVIIPNERLAAGILRNDTLGSDVVGLDVSVWLPPDADVAARAGGARGGDRAARERRRGRRPTASGISVAGDTVPPPRAGRAGRAARAVPQRAARRGIAGGNPSSVGELRQGYTRLFALL